MSLLSASDPTWPAQAQVEAERWRSAGMSLAKSATILSILARLLSFVFSLAGLLLHCKLGEQILHQSQGLEPPPVGEALERLWKLSHLQYQQVLRLAGHLALVLLH